MTFSLHLVQLKVLALVLIHIYFQKLLLFHWRKFGINILYSPSQCYLVHFLEQSLMDYQCHLVTVPLNLPVLNEAIPQEYFLN